MLRIIHLTVLRNLSFGQEKQLLWEIEAAKNLDTAHWDTLVFHDGLSSAPFIKRVPLLFRFIFLRNLYAWLVVLKLSRYYDFILMRHITFDPFSFIFAPLIKNRISIHHAKDVEALRIIRKGWKGWAASVFELYSGRYTVRHARAILGVTYEIAQYQIKQSMMQKSVGIYPNGININQVNILGDVRIDNEIHICFICGKFTEWQGLDKLIKAVDACKVDDLTVPVYIHLIGQLSDLQFTTLQAAELRRKIFRSYGLLSEAEYRPILEQCDFGFDSLAIEREGLREACSLKVREMLALGLAVYSNHDDAALDRSAPFIKVTGQVDIIEMISFGLSCKNISRTLVRNNSQKLIDKLSMMKMVVDFIESGFKSYSHVVVQNYDNSKSTSDQ